MLSHNTVCLGLGRPIPHEGINSHANMGSRLPPQAQAMGVGPMGLYPGVMPYGMVPQPGLHHQVRHLVLYIVLCQDAFLSCYIGTNSVAIVLV